ncbi:MAG: prolyl-tRNA synthetase associated domain-containing protein [Alphaproteobacteria bacterium]|nr:prolyl-tRNA synthetase associated domain-containing protein [Alphaproteobacteria bacterium]MBN2779458.1 prolyl-tRNA synthetase associated domain-containing protein [Alphaproteobacteria bacterium]
MKQKLYDLLNDAGVVFEEHNHPALFTCEDTEKHNVNIPAAHCKTLFLVNKHRCFLLSTLAEKRIDIGALSKKLMTSRLSFGTPDVLYDLLNVKPGSVNPFSLMYDIENKVECLLDLDMMGCNKLGFHPMINTATIVLAPNDLKLFLEKIHKPFIIL